VFIKKVVQQVKIKRTIDLRKNELENKKIKSIESQISSYIPGGFRSLNSLNSEHGHVKTGQHM
jgi:hypothetical protein